MVPGGGRREKGVGLARGMRFAVVVISDVVFLHVFVLLLLLLLSILSLLVIIFIIDVLVICFVFVVLLLYLLVVAS